MQIQKYCMNRKEQILQMHIDNVCRIYAPDDKGGHAPYFMTKFYDGISRKNSQQMLAKTREALEDKIVAKYLQIKADKDITIRDELIYAIKQDTAAKADTGVRLRQRFDKHWSKYARVKVSALDERTIRQMLDSLQADNVTKKEFNGTISALNKIAEECEYDYVPICPVKQYISTWRKHKVANKTTAFKNNQKEARDLAFTSKETAAILQSTWSNNMCYRSLAIALLLVTGLRIGELVALEISDIYLDDNDRYISVNKAENGKTRVIQEPKKNKHRNVALTDQAVQIVRLCLAYRRHDADIDNPYLFLTDYFTDKRKIHREEINNYLKCEIHHDVLHLDDSREARSVHDCRRTYASLEYLNGTKIHRLMLQMGHADEAETWDYIKDVCDIEERKTEIKGIGITLDIPANAYSDCVNAS
jgi:integrase